jgi:hypothetical protein
MIPYGHMTGKSTYLTYNKTLAQAQKFSFDLKSEIV